MADEVKNVVIKVKVEGDTKALASIARIETALARQQTAAARIARQTSSNTTAIAKHNAALKQTSDVIGLYIRQAPDLVSVLSNGGNAFIAFGQQALQVNQQLAATGKELTGFAKFMAGPWLTVIVAAAAILTPYIAKLFEAEDAAKKQAEAQKTLMESIETVRKAQQAAIDTQETKTKNDLAAAQAAQKSASDNVLAAEAELYRAEAILKVSEAMLNAPGADADVAAAAFQRIIDSREQIQELQTKIEGLRKALQDAGTNARDLRRQIIDIDIGSMTDKAAAAQRRYNDEIERAANDFNQLKINEEEYIRRRIAANTRLKADQDAIAKSEERAERDRRSRAEAAEKRRREINERFQKNFGGDFAGDLAKSRTTFEKLQDDIAAAAFETAKLNRELDDLVRLQDSIGNSPLMNRKISERIKEIEQTLDPVLSKTRDWIDLMNKGGRGGSQAANILNQRNELQAQFDKAQTIGGLTPEAIEKVTKDLADLENQYDELTQTVLESQLTDTLVDGINELADGLSSVIDGTKSMADAFEDAAKSIIKELTKIIAKMAIMKLLTTLFGGSAGGDKFLGKVAAQLKLADGGVFESGQVKKFASGGVVSSPTYFNIGEMGEAGPEAIMPLRRGSNGQLGVQSTPPTVIINNYGNDNVTVDQARDATIITIAAEQARKMITHDIKRGGTPVSRSIESVYGVSRAR